VSIEKIKDQKPYAQSGVAMGGKRD
jgi:hypothetical protein